MISKFHNEIKSDLIKCGVYTITNLINGKMYVGSTSTYFGERWRKHSNDLKKGVHHSKKLQHSYNKYGCENFMFEILDITDKYSARHIENYWMNMLDTVTYGYNITYSTNGGCLGCKRTDEHKLALSKANKNNNNFGGYNHSIESIKQIKNTLNIFYTSDSEEVKNLKLKRRETRINFNKTILSIRNKIPVLQLDVKTNMVIKEWNSASDVEKTTGMFATSITKVCKGKSNHAYGYKWVYKF